MRREDAAGAALVALVAEACRLVVETLTVNVVAVAHLSVVSLNVVVDKLVLLVVVSRSVDVVPLVEEILTWAVDAVALLDVAVLLDVALLDKEVVAVLRAPCLR